jgi:hypothetical protein
LAPSPSSETRAPSAITIQRATLHIYDAGDHLFFVAGPAFDQLDRLRLVFHSGPYNRQVSDVIAGRVRIIVSGVRKG